MPGETLLVGAWHLKTGLSLQREANEQGLVSTPPFSVNCLLLDLKSCTAYLARGLVSQVLGFFLFIFLFLAVPRVVQGVKCHIFHQASGGSQKASVRWYGEDETYQWAPWDRDWECQSILGIDLRVGAASLPLHAHPQRCVGQVPSGGGCLGRV